MSLPFRLFLGVLVGVFMMISTPRQVHAQAFWPQSGNIFIQGLYPECDPMTVNLHDGTAPFNVWSSSSSSPMRSYFNMLHSYPGVQANRNQNAVVFNNNGRGVSIAAPNPLCYTTFGVTAANNCLPPGFRGTFDGSTFTQDPINVFGNTVLQATAPLPLVCELDAALPGLTVGTTFSVTVGTTTVTIDITPFETPFSLALRISNALGTVGTAEIGLDQRLNIFAYLPESIHVAGWTGSQDITQVATNAGVPIDLTTLPGVVAGGQIDIDPGNGVPFTVTINAGDTAYDLAANINAAAGGTLTAGVNHAGQLFIDSNFEGLTFTDNVTNPLGAGLASLGITAGVQTAMSTTGLDLLGFTDTQPPGTTDGRVAAPQNFLNFNGTAVTETNRPTNTTAKLIGTVGNLDTVTDLTTLPGINPGDTFTIDPATGTPTTITIYAGDSMSDLAARITAAFTRSVTSVPTPLPTGQTCSTASFPPSCTCNSSTSMLTCTSAISDVYASLSNTGLLTMSAQTPYIEIGAGSLSTLGLQSIGLSLGRFGVATTYVGFADIQNISPTDLTSLPQVNAGDTFIIDPGDNGAQITITVAAGETAASLAAKITSDPGCAGRCSATINSNGQLEITSTVGGVTIFEGTMSIIGMNGLGIGLVPQTGATFQGTQDIVVNAASPITLDSLPNVAAGQQFQVDPGTGVFVPVTINAGDTAYDLADAINLAIDPDGYATVRVSGEITITTNNNGTLRIQDISLGAAGMADLGLANVSIAAGTGPALSTQIANPSVCNLETVTTLNTASEFISGQPVVGASSGCPTGTPTAAIGTAAYAETHVWQEPGCVTPVFDFSGQSISSTLCYGTSFINFVDDLNTQIQTQNIDASIFFDAQGSLTIVNNTPTPLTMSGVNCLQAFQIGSCVFSAIAGCPVPPPQPVTVGGNPPPTPPTVPPPPPPPPVNSAVSPGSSTWNTIVGAGAGFLSSYLTGGSNLTSFLGQQTSTKELPAIEDMAKQISVGKIDQNRLVGSLDDAVGFAKELRKHQEDEVEEYQRARPSELSCSGATAVDGMNRSEQVAKAVQKAMANRSLVLDTNQAGSAAQHGSADFLRLVFQEYQNTFCNPTHNAGNTQCTTAPPPPLPDADVLIGETLLNKLTLDYSLPEDRAAIRALVRNLMKPIPHEPIDPQSLGHEDQQYHLLIKRRKDAARRNLAMGVITGIIGRRTPGASDAQLGFNYVQWLRQIQQNAGIPASAFGGKDPSYNEIMHIITKQRYWWPGYFARLGSANNIEQEQNLLDSFTLMQLRDQYELMEQINALLAVRTALKVEQNISTAPRGNTQLTP